MRTEACLPVLTDAHESGQVKAVAQLVDVLHTPAFLARKTDFIAVTAASGKLVNIKSGDLWRLPT